LTVAASIEPAELGFAGRHVDGAGFAQCCKGCFAGEQVWLVADGQEQGCGGADAVSLQQLGCAGVDGVGDPLVQVDLAGEFDDPAYRVGPSQGRRIGG
jgi:hypothetical protein